MADSENPKPDFDFIMKQEPKPKRSFNFSAPSNLPKPVFFGGIAVFLLLLILIIGSIFSGGSNVPNLYSVLSGASTISITSEEAIQTAANADTRTVAVTAKQTMESQQQRVKSYMTTNKVKIDAKQIATVLDAETSAQLKSAQQNNTYDAAYLTYLKLALQEYQANLNAVSQEASPTLKAILDEAQNSNKVLLANKLLQ